MPKKIRELKSLLKKAGFTDEPAKGSHTKWAHPLVSGKLTLSGNEGDDAKPYQEKDVMNALNQLIKTQEKNNE